VTVLVPAAPAAAAEYDVTFASLLDEMTDRESVARFPDPAYTCRQASSYDRASTSADEPGSWMANNDRSFFVRSEEHQGREEWVMMDAEGAGAIVRWWITASAARGIIRIYIDGAEEPAVAAVADELVAGEALVGPPLAAMRARGRNLYLPIPYAKRCVVTYDRPNFQQTKKNEDLLYYQINYRTYEPGTKVEPFSMDVFDANKENIASLQKRLLEPGKALPDGMNLPSSPPVILPAGETKTIFSYDAPGAVRLLSIQLQADDLALAARQTVLIGVFDDQQTIWCPVGDFFGSGVGVNPFQDWWRGVSEIGTMGCYWPMPFEKSCSLKLANLGKQPVTVGTTVGSAPWKWDDRSMHLHADWRQEYPIDSAVKRDWNYVTVNGRGAYVGDTLSVVNPVRAWWGEGDEKIYFDDQPFPSHFGTGTEDYYGYAWCTAQRFDSPFHAQPRADGPGNFGHVTNSRVRMLDAIPFTKNFRFDMEVWHWHPCEVAYAVATHWYGRPGAKSLRQPDPEQLVVVEAVPPKPPKVEGAIEGEKVEIVEKTGGVTEIQDVPQFRWSENRQIWWRDAEPGDTLTLAFKAEQKGSYLLKAALTKAIDYGIVQLSLDGKSLGEPLDLINDGVITKVYELGTHDLEAGRHTFSAKITGSNPKAVKRHMFGVDYLLLEPQND
jgi:hypothetical protein